MTKITPEHLTRGAYIYVRQSTADQLLHNHESRRRQYGLADRARDLGWQEVVVIDDDLGRSGSGISRPGFERLLAAICEGRVGSVFAIEACPRKCWRRLVSIPRPARAYPVECRSMCTCTGKGSLAASPARSIILAMPIRPNG